MTRTWRKSSHSGSPSQDCVEVAFTHDVAVRDSKNPEPRLVFPAAAWHRFLHTTKR